MSVQEYIYSKQGNQRSILLVLDQLFMEYPKVISKLRYKIPFYYQKSWICYLNPIKDRGVDLVFVRGRELSNEQGLLDSKGRKQVAGIQLYDHKDIPVPIVREIFNEALLLDEMVPYSVRK